jgi:glycosyltransferase involved in cell wall biosynthesis
MFFPRGGSAHVARALACELPAHGWDVTLVTGSRSAGHGDARAFYRGLDVRPVDFDAGDAPMHPSFEDRPGAPDPVFAAVDDAGFEAHVGAWAHALAGAHAEDCDVLHLHHLTPLHEAAARVAPDVPVVTHLHGTELLMLEAIEEGAPWPHAAAWARRMRRWAQASERLLVLSPGQVDRAVALLGIDAQRCVVCPNGFDPEAFDRLDIDRAAHWRHHLVDAPRGWAPGAGEGSIAYQAADIAPLARAGAPVAITVSRFTAVKRIGLLIRAWAGAQAAGRLPDDASLVVLGGYPGEWEGEHPADAIAAAGARNVFLAGWHGHDELPAFLSAADIFVLASVREQFGSVLVEGMACGLPPIAVDRFGPADIVRDGQTGWLVGPDDQAQLADALVAALADPVERRRRGRRAWRDARERFSWPALAGDLAAVLDEVGGVAPDASQAARTPA